MQARNKTRKKGRTEKWGKVQRKERRFFSLDLSDPPKKILGSFINSAIASSKTITINALKHLQ